MNLERLKGKKIALIGFGIENISLAKFLTKNKLQYIVLDKEPLGNLSTEAQEFIISDQIKLISGDDYLSHLSDYDLVVRSPGIKYLTPEIQQAGSAGVEISSSTKLFFEFCPGKIVGVTGTKGKGTTSSLIFEILKNSKKNNVFLVGNIGIPSFDILDEVGKDDFVVFELSSFQLQDLDRSPWIAVMVNLDNDHLDYHESLAEYRESKQNIFKYQKREDIAIINYDYPESKKMEEIVNGQKYFFSSKSEIKNGAYVDSLDKVILSLKDTYVVCELSEIKLIGRHNLENIAAASIAASLAGASSSKIRATVLNFSGLPHRLEFVRNFEGVEFYNDSFSTNPTPTIAAVRAFSSPITLIVGGSEKGADFSEMSKEIKNSSVKNVITIGVEGLRIKKTLEEFGVKSNFIRGGKNIDEIVGKAFKITEPGGVVLFSPACASFDMFKNYKDRGEKFKQAVSKL